MEPLTGCSQTGIPLSTGNLPVVYGTTGYVQRFPAARVNPGGGEGANVSGFPAPSSCLLDLIPATTTSVCLHTQVFFSRLTTGLDFTTSVFELPCASSTLFNCKYCVYRLYITCCAARRHNLARFFICSPVFNCK